MTLNTLLLLHTIAIIGTWVNVFAITLYLFNSMGSLENELKLLRNLLNRQFQINPYLTRKEKYHE